jgi:hypothetical protein
MVVEGLLFVVFEDAENSHDDLELTPQAADASGLGYGFGCHGAVVYQGIVWQVLEPGYGLGYGGLGVPCVKFEDFDTVRAWRATRRWYWTKRAILSCPFMPFMNSPSQTSFSIFLVSK